MLLGVFPGECLACEGSCLSLLLLEVGAVVTVYLVEKEFLLRHGGVTFQTLSKDLTHLFPILACFLTTVIFRALDRMGAIVLL